MWDAAAFNLVSFAAALTWAMCLRIRPLRLAPLAVLLLHVIIIQAWVLLTGVAGELNVAAWRWTAGALAVFVTAIWIVRRRTLGDELGAWRLRGRRTLRRIGYAIALPVTLLIVAFIIGLGLCGYFVGPFIPDVLHYHLTPPAVWTASGGIEPHHWNDPRSWWPQGHGLLAMWWMLPPRAFHAATLAELHWVALAFAVVWALARNFGASARTAALAVALVVTVPVVWAQATSGLNDLAVSALLLAALAAVTTRRVNYRHLMLAATAILLGLAIKPTMLILAAPVVVLGLVRWYRCSRCSGGRGSRRAAGRMTFATVTPLIALALGGFWYVNAAVHMHNPLYPAGLHLPGMDPLPGAANVERQVGRISFDQLRANLLDLAVNKAWDRQRLRNAQTDDGSGFGGPAIVLGIPALLALAIRGRGWRPRGRNAATVAAIVACVLILAASVQADAWNGRFFSFIPLAAVAAVPLVGAMLRHRVAQAIWVVLLVTSGAWSVVEGARVVVPPLARTWFETQGLVPVPTQILVMNKYAFMMRSAQEVPPDQPLVIVNLEASGPVSAMVGEDLSRQIIFHDDIPDPYQTLAWNEAGRRWILAVATLEELPEVDIAMQRVGLVPVAPGLYVIP